MGVQLKVLTQNKSISLIPQCVIIQLDLNVVGALTDYRSTLGPLLGLHRVSLRCSAEGRSPQMTLRAAWADRPRPRAGRTGGDICRGKCRRHRLGPKMIFLDALWEYFLEILSVWRLLIDLSDWMVNVSEENWAKHSRRLCPGNLSEKKNERKRSYFTSSRYNMSRAKTAIVFVGFCSDRFILIEYYKI